MHIKDKSQEHDKSHKHDKSQEQKKKLLRSRKTFCEIKKRFLSLKISAPVITNDYILKDKFM